MNGYPLRRWIKKGLDLNSKLFGNLAQGINARILYAAILYVRDGRLPHIEPFCQIFLFDSFFDSENFQFQHE